MNKRFEIEAIVNAMDTRKSHNAVFNFGGYTWTAPVVKRLLSTFDSEEVVVTVGEMNSNPALIFKWKQGHAFIYSADVVKNMKAQINKCGAII